MEDISQSKGILQGRALELGKLLEDHRGGKVLVMDLRNLNFWTDFFVIATVTSSTHSMGLERHIKEFLRERGLEIFQRSRKPKAAAESGADEWRLLDLGGIVIHLMTERTRSFYELERLWSAAPFIFQGADMAQSSKSS